MHGGGSGGIQRAKRQPDAAAVYVGDGCAARCCRPEREGGVRGSGLDLCLKVAIDGRLRAAGDEKRE